MADLILTERSNIVAIADAVRCRTGETGEMTIGKIVNDINYVVGSIEPSLQDKTVTPSTSSKTITADSGYDGLGKVTVSAMPTATQATPSITINSSGLITATATQTAGYVSAGTKSGTKQLTTQAAKTITPSKSSQTAVASGRYTTGEVTVAAIPSKYVDVSGATASASDVMSGKTFGAGTAVKTGTFTLDSELTTQEILISQIATALEGKAAGGGSGGTSVETCTFTFSGKSSNYYYPKYISYMTINESGVITTIEETCSSNSVTVNCLCDSIVVVQTNGKSNVTVGFNNCSLLYHPIQGFIIFHIEATSGGSASFSNTPLHGGGSN